MDIWTPLSESDRRFLRNEQKSKERSRKWMDKQRAKYEKIKPILAKLKAGEITMKEYHKRISKIK